MARSVALLTALALLLGCSDAPHQTTAEARRPRNAVLIVLDTARADRMSCYGHSRDTTPTLSALGEQAVVFEKAVSSAPWTLPGFRSILSARDVTRMTAPPNKLSGSVVESIRAAGFSTAAITEGGFVSREFGFDLGFHEYVEEEGEVQLVSRDKPRDPTADGGIEKTFRLAKEWVEAHRDEPFFLLIHTYEPHAPYTRRTYSEGLRAWPMMDGLFALGMQSLLETGRVQFDEEDLRYLGALYDGGILESDRQIGLFLERLEELGLRGDTLIVVTSDHGEELGEHYVAHSGNHGHSLLDDLLLIPLVVLDPLNTYPVKRVATQVRSMDIMPTIADILGVEVGMSIDGTSLIPLMRGEESADRIAYGGRTKYDPRRIFVRYHGYKYIKVIGPGKGRPVTPPPPEVQLYDLGRDPEERVNLAASEPGMVERFEELVASLPIASETDDVDPLEQQELDEQLLERLRSLGYVD